MARKNRTHFVAIGRNIYRTTGTDDHGNGGEDVVFVRSFASREAALNWLWANHPKQ